jgi:hypothetical protein
MRRTLRSVLSALACLVAQAAGAADLSLSGFGTIGYARSDRPYAYERFIDDRGTFRRDSILGMQADARFLSRWGATVQATLAPPIDRDNGWRATPTWAFVSYRPDDDWLLRAGKLRIPVYLHTANMDVGATFDVARLPVETYTITPISDFTGAAFSKTWHADSGEWALEGYWGSTATHFRYFIRDDFPPLSRSGPSFVPVDVESGGLVLTLTRAEDTYRIGMHHSAAIHREGKEFPKRFPFVNIAPGIGYYQTDKRLPGPGTEGSSRAPVQTFTLAADIGLPGAFRAVGEYTRRRVDGFVTGPDSHGAYLTLYERSGRWTPYVTAARMLSMPGSRKIRDAVNRSRVPDSIPGAALINASQRLGADMIPAYDQGSLAIGTSYALTPTSKLKAEWMRIRMGGASTLIDAPPGSDIRNERINVFSLSYNFVF